MSSGGAFARLAEFVRRHRVGVLIFGIVTVVVLIIIGVVMGVRRGNMAYVNIVVSPSIASVRVGDSVYGAVGEHEIWPGEYSVEVYADGFISKTGHLVIAPRENISVMLYLEPSAENAGWYDSHPWDATARGDIVAQTELSEFYALRDAWPVLKYVPYEMFTYKIGYEVGADDVLALTVDAGLGFRDFAVEYLKGVAVDDSSVDLAGFKFAAGFDAFDKFNFSFSGEGGDLSGLKLDLNAGAGSSAADFNFTAVGTAAIEFAGEYLKEGYTAELLQIKPAGDYALVKLKVYPAGQDETIYDTYRVVLGLVDGKWIGLTTPAMLLNYYDNPLVPGEVVRAGNGF